MNPMSHFPSIIAEERKRAGLTQEALATRLGITPQAISKWENGVSYPDVTLFPVIAEVLGLSVARLFGETEMKPSRIGKLPDTYGGMDFVLAVGEYVCYAAKTVREVDEESGIVRFSDGSEANLHTVTVTNRGAGEIRIYKISELMGEVVWEDECPSVDFDQSYEGIRSYRLSMGVNCSLMITADGEAGRTRVSAKGDARFIAAIAATHEGDTLCIEVKDQNNRDGSNTADGNVLHIHTGTERAHALYATINGACETAISVDFDRLEMTVNGCGDIAAGNADEAVLKINGCGDVKMQESRISTNVKINGSGVVKMAHAHAPTFKINGSGDIDCGEVSGEMNVTVNGSGDIVCGGEADQMTLSVNGSGDFHGSELVVGNATICVPNSASHITIGRIKGTSVERIGKKCKLTVAHRGEV